MRGSFEVRLLAKIAGPWQADVGVDDCWLYVGRWRSTFGYGRIREGRHAGRCLLAHREMFKLYCGAIADSEVVRHLCNVPLCCNPRHLRKGTQAENIADQLRVKLARSLKRRRRERFWV